MATVNKDFKIKHGLIVEGTSGTINNYDILTKSPTDQTYIIGLIGGSATADATPDTVVLRDGNANFAANDITVNNLSVGSVADIYDDGALIIQSNSGSGIDITANQALYMTSQNSDIVLSADGWVYLGNNSSMDNRVATMGDITAGSIQSVSGTTNEIDASTTNGAVTLSLPTTVYKPDLSIGYGQGFDIYFSDNDGNTYINNTSGAGYIHALGNFSVDYATNPSSPDYFAFQVDTAGARTRVRNAINIQNDSQYNTFDINGNQARIEMNHPDTDNRVLNINSDGYSATIEAAASNLYLKSWNDAYLQSQTGHVYIQPNGNLYVQSNAEFNNSALIARTLDVGGNVYEWDGAINLYDYTGSQKINLDASTGNISIPRYGQVKFGNGNDDLGWLWLDSNSNDKLRLEGNQGIIVQSYFENPIDVIADGDLHLTSNVGDIVLSASNAAYYGSVSAENEIATHGYVDNAVAGLNWKQAVNLLWNDPNATLTGATGTLAIDNHVALTTSHNGYRILITTGNNRGIWDYSDDGSNWILTRSTDADAVNETIGAAVYVMEGDQFGSTSWVQGNHYATQFTDQVWTQFSGQGSVTAGTGITVNGLEVSVDRTTVDGWYEASGAVADHANDTATHGVGEIVGTSEAQTLTNKSISGSSNTLTNIPNNALDHDSITINGYSTALGSSVTLDTGDISEGTNKYYTDQRVKDVLTGATKTNIQITDVAGVLSITAENGVADSTTDDLAEGETNLYFTDGRAKDSAADLLVNATKSNITITGTGAGLTITAENGVADSTTDDLEEGVNNLYFTDQRAVSALEGVVPNFTEIDINSLATQIAATTSVPTASQVTAYAFAKADYRSAKFLVKCAYSTHTEITEVLLTLDTTDNISITEYATVGTNGSSMTVTADVSGTDVRLRVTTVNNNSTVTVMGTLLA